MAQMIGLWRNHFTRVFVLATLLTMTLGFVGLPFTQTIVSAHVATTNGCQLNSPSGKVNHVIYVQFDNVHFMRDNPNVPSDLEQMPHLLNFMQQNGVVLSNHHTPLIAHTANDILTSLTGVYPNNHGVPIANSFRYFNPNGTSNLGVSFAYWNGAIFDPTTSTPTDTTFNMLTAQWLERPCTLGAVYPCRLQLWLCRYSKYNLREYQCRCLQDLWTHFSAARGGNEQSTPGNR